MPQLFAVLLFVVGVGPLPLTATAASLLSGIYALGNVLVSVGISLGLGLLQSALTPRRRAPAPEDVKSNLKSAVQPRYRHYGRVRAGLTPFWTESSKGAYYKNVYVGEGPINGFLAYYIDDKIVTPNGSGVVTAAPFDSKLIIHSRVGDNPSPQLTHLETAFPGVWTTDHRAHGCAILSAVQLAVPSNKFSSVFPRGAETQYTAVIEGEKLIPYDGIGANVYSDNLARVVFDFMAHPKGLGWPIERLRTPQALEAWARAIEICDDQIPLKAGGFEARYRVAVSHSFEERKVDVLQRILAAGDAYVIFTSDGGISIEVGRDVDDSFVFDANNITGFSNLRMTLSNSERVNVLKCKFYDQANQYSTGDADPLTDETHISGFGEQSASIELICSPSHGQTRRLMVAAFARMNAPFSATLTVNNAGLGGMRRRYCRVRFPIDADLEIDLVCEVKKFDLNITEQGALAGATVEVASFPADTYTKWVALTDEGRAPAIPDPITAEEIPIPAAPVLAVIREAIGAAQVPYISLTVDDPANPGLQVKAEFKKSADSIWTAIAFSPDQNISRFGAVQDGTTYDVRAWYSTLLGRDGVKSAISSIAVVADPTAPAVPTAVSGTGGAGQATINWTSPSSANYAYALIKRNTINNEGAAATVATRYGPQNTAQSFVDTGLAAGTYFYWVRSSNASGVTSAAVATGSLTVT
jgi:hypothetical protein